ncbi:MAG: gliding motility-associated C-terminal domain-containing protein [Flammeovirgaceae bacterium]|nr:gliding motility-associated C-terminal domain-containing protein [Flammeovirgaceae bacterium]
MKRSFNNILKTMVDSRWPIADDRSTIDYRLWTFLFFLVSVSATAQTIARAEYFYDNDPGVGNATSLSIAPGASINQTYNLSTSSLATGFHTFNARVQDNTGKWSLFTTRTFYIIPNPFILSPSTNITKAEYFYDTDPGVGNATNIPVTASPTQNLTINTPTTALTPGFHTANVRVRDDQGRWSLFTTRTFYLMPASALPANLVKLEYYVNTDPGIGQATSVAIAQAPTVNQLFNLNLPVLTPGNYTLNVRAKDSNGYWSSRVSAPFTIAACTPPSAPTAANGSRCGNGTITLTASGASGSQVYRWYVDNVTTTILFTGASFTTPLLNANTTYFVSIFDPATCESSRSSVTATINNLPIAPTVTGAAACGSGSLTLNASGGSAGQYRWYTVATGGSPITGQTNSSFVTPSISTTTMYYVSIDNGTCESNRVSVVATINTAPNAPTGTNAIGCSPSASVTLSASGGSAGQYRWYTVPTGGTAMAGQTNSSFTTPSLSATTTYYVSIDNGTCESPRTAVIATIQACGTPPTIATQPLSTPIGSITKPLNLIPLITTFNNSSISSISITIPPASGAKATIANGFLTIDYTGIAFSGTDKLTIRACDANGNCATQEFSIDVFGDIVIYNALSPGGANPTFVLQYIDIIPETKNNLVTVFDRWQNEVWKGENYNNSSVVFKGISDDGSDLPTGTYFYKIEFAGGRKTKTGFISLKR